MAKLEALKHLFSQLHSPATNEAQILQSISEEWNEIRSSGMDVKEALKNNNIFLILTKVMNENLNAWKTNFPTWVYELLLCALPYRGELDLFSVNRTYPLVTSFRKYVMGGYWDAMRAFHLLAAFSAAKQVLLEDVELYNILKKEIKRSYVANFIGNCASGGFEPWQKKIMEDGELVKDLLVLSEENDQIWDVFVNLTQHPDAKTLLPKEVTAKAGKAKYISATNVYALLCSDDDLNVFKLDASWIATQTDLLISMLATGQAVVNRVNFSLLSIILPIANISAADNYKDELGRRAVVPLLSVVTDQLLDVAPIRSHLIRCRQEASRALWNLAYLKSNCTLITEANGIEKLKKALGQTDDVIIKKNISGILHMCGPPIPNPVVQASVSKGHVMISYNWGNQEIVLKIAQSLKENGYSVWLDVEQMAGSTLEAMALAVEHSSLVLMCMSQKYKDSPNCRLEGEYCVNRKVDFLPLMMQPGYKPDGWLGITLGSKLWYDFSDDHNWDAKFSLLTKGMGDKGKEKVKRGTATSPPSSPAAPAIKKVVDWTLEDMQKWMKAERIDQHYETLKKHKFDGRALLELKSLHTHHQPTFFKEICNDMAINEIGDILRLSAAIRNL